MLEYASISLFLVYAIAVNVQLFLIKRAIKPIQANPPEPKSQPKILVSQKRVIEY